MPTMLFISCIRFSLQLMIAESAFLTDMKRKEVAYAFTTNEILGFRN